MLISDQYALQQAVCSLVSWQDSTSEQDARQDDRGNSGAQAFTYCPPNARICMLTEVGSSHKLEPPQDVGEAVLDSFFDNGMPVLGRINSYGLPYFRSVPGSPSLLCFLFPANNT